MVVVVFTFQIHKEQEKAFMLNLRGASCSIGEYVGNGKGEAYETASAPADGPMGCRLVPVF